MTNLDLGSTALVDTKAHHAFTKQPLKHLSLFLVLLVFISHSIDFRRNISLYVGIALIVTSP